MIFIKSEYDLEMIRHAVSIWKKAQEAVNSAIRVGMTLKELDLILKDAIEGNGGTCAFHKYQGFPGYNCISVNECIIHGIPNDYALKDGDSVTFDVGTEYKKHFCDAAFTIIVGEASDEAIHIRDTARQAIDEAVKIIKPGVSTKKISKVIEEYVKSQGYYLLHDFTGHGCGNQIHEDPAIPNYVTPFIPGFKLVENMVICIEPMIMTDSRKFYMAENNWSIIASNKKLSSHWEHMIWVTADGCEVLTK